MSMIEKRILAAAVVGLSLPACAHKEPVSVCPPCEILDEQRSKVSELESAIAKLRNDTATCEQTRSQSDDPDLTFSTRWEDAFSGFADFIEEQLEQTGESDEGEDSSEESEGDDILTDSPYLIEISNGNLELTFSNDVFFEPGKAALTAQGKKRMVRLADMIQRIEDGNIMVGCRPAAVVAKQRHAMSRVIKELASKRAIVIVTELEKNSVDPERLTAASLSNKTDEEMFEGGSTVIIISPSPKELLKHGNAL